MTTTTTAAPKSNGAAKTKSAAKRQPAKRQPSKPKPSKPKPSKPAKTTPTAAPKTAPKTDADRKAATVANAALFHDGPLNMSQTSAPAVAGMRKTLAAHPKLAKSAAGISTAKLTKYARGQQKPTDEDRATGRQITAAFGETVYGLTTANTRNKMVGRRVWTVLYALRVEKS